MMINQRVPVVVSDAEPAVTSDHHASGMARQKPRRCCGFAGACVKCEYIQYVV
jgi:hypothetical protein